MSYVFSKEEERIFKYGICNRKERKEKERREIREREKIKEEEDIKKLKNMLPQTVLQVFHTDNIETLNTFLETLSIDKIVDKRYIIDQSTGKINYIIEYRKINYNIEYKEA